MQHNPCYNLWWTYRHIEVANFFWSPATSIIPFETRSIDGPTKVGQSWIIYILIIRKKHLLNLKISSFQKDTYSPQALTFQATLADKQPKVSSGKATLQLSQRDKFRPSADILKGKFTIPDFSWENRWLPVSIFPRLKPRTIEPEPRLPILLRQGTPKPSDLDQWSDHHIPAETIGD